MSNNLTKSVAFSLLAVGALCAQKTYAISGFDTHPLHEYMNIESAKALSSALSSVRGNCRKGIELNSRTCQNQFNSTVRTLKRYGFEISPTDLVDPKLYTLSDELNSQLKEKLKSLRKNGDRQAANALNHKSMERRAHLKDKSNRAPKNHSSDIDNEINRVIKKLENERNQLSNRAGEFKNHPFKKYFVPEGVNALTTVLKDVPNTCRNNSSSDCEVYFSNAALKAKRLGFSNISGDDLSSPKLYGLYKDLSAFSRKEAKVYSGLETKVHKSFLSLPEKKKRLALISKQQTQISKLQSNLIQQFNSGTL